ncbi:plasmid transfer protein TraA [Streptomyces lavendulae]|uniref:plasmid transfer protein TraA n=1 Tax=Streptomyces lavendulae TaxID=1914 RepID=UPI0033215820
MASSPNTGLRAVSPRSPQPPAQRQPVNRTNNVNVKIPDWGSFVPKLSLTVNKTVVNGGGAAGGVSPKAAPGSDFTSNEDIHAYSNHGRRLARDRSSLAAMDAEALEAILRHIPDTHGSFSGARMRAMRVARHLKRIAIAERFIAKSYVSLYASFQKEYEAELNKIGKGRAQQQPRQPFNWG